MCLPTPVSRKVTWMHPAKMGTLVFPPLRYPCQGCSTDDPTAAAQVVIRAPPTSFQLPGGGTSTPLVSQTPLKILPTAADLAHELPPGFKRLPSESFGEDRALTLMAAYAQGDCCCPVEGCEPPTMAESTKESTDLCREVSDMDVDVASEDGHQCSYRCHSHPVIIHKKHSWP